MSWCRFGSPCEEGCARCPGSDLYIFNNTDNRVECMSCLLMPTNSTGFRTTFECNTDEEMLKHVLEHDAAGHHVRRTLLAAARGEITWGDDDG